MDGQTIAVLIVVALASCYLSWRGWRMWSGAKRGCSTGCGCGSAVPHRDGNPVLIPSSALKLRERT